MTLSFQKGNAKLGKNIHTFSLPAGWTCPGAHDCLAKVKNGKLVDGQHTKFRCFAASQEALFPSVSKSRQANLAALKGLDSDQIAELILASLDDKATIVRVHVSGDFFSEAYFLGWMKAANARPQTVFYAYTKSLNLWVNNVGAIPSNFRLTASKGGRFDQLIKLHSLKYAEVVFSIEQAQALDLEIDHDDSHAYGSDRSFALLLHGAQPKGSVASKALSALRAQGHKGYSRKVVA